MVFTNPILMKKDQDDFSDLWHISKLEDKVIYHSDINFDVSALELIIFDEADEYIYGDPKHFLKLISKHKCICLTATCGGSKQEAAEKSILIHLGLKVFDKVLIGKCPA